MDLKTIKSLNWILFLYERSDLQLYSLSLISILLSFFYFLVHKLRKCWIGILLCLGFWPLWHVVWTLKPSDRGQNTKPLVQTISQLPNINQFFYTTAKVYGLRFLLLPSVPVNLVRLDEKLQSCAHPYLENYLTKLDEILHGHSPNGSLKWFFFFEKLKLKWLMIVPVF